MIWFLWKVIRKKTRRSMTREEKKFWKNKGERDGCQAMAEDSYGDVWSAADRSSASEHTDSS
ncbi:hypothetical protein, partial [Nitrosomonas sp.]|uniref:hypothetical protein n=1 Tax=Nitrosomonas sp. TaxID=42353 RepID=UPI00272AEFFE